MTVSSAAARVGAINMGPYTVSKFAVSGYCEVIRWVFMGISCTMTRKEEWSGPIRRQFIIMRSFHRQELKYFGVSVHVLEPGIFNTPMAAVSNITVGIFNSSVQLMTQQGRNVASKQFQMRLDDMWSKAPAATKKEYGEGFYQESERLLLLNLPFSRWRPMRMPLQAKRGCSDRSASRRILTWMSSSMPTSTLSPRDSLIYDINSAPTASSCQCFQWIMPVHINLSINSIENMCKDESYLLLCSRALASFHSHSTSLIQVSATVVHAHGSEGRHIYRARDGEIPLSNRNIRSF